VETPTSEPALAQGFSGPGLDSLLMPAARARLREMLPSELTARDLVLTGKPCRAILQLAQEQANDLIVVGAHGGLATIFGVGSTTHYIVREATCPVISVRA
jgi:nucleotide-binding universal stress UspA family protein